MEQLRNIRNNLSMVDTKCSIIEVVGVRIYHHAGDLDDGIDNSFFVVATCRQQGHDYVPVEYRMVMNRHNDHGESLQRVRQLAGKIMAKGFIDGRLWHTS